MKNCVPILLIAFTMVFISCKEDKDLKETSADNSTEMKASHQSKEKSTNAHNFKTYTGKELNDYMEEGHHDVLTTNQLKRAKAFFGIIPINMKLFKPGFINNSSNKI